MPLHQKLDGKPVIVEGRKRVVIEEVAAEIDAGCFPIKRVAGDRVFVEADIFADGHDHAAAWLLYCAVTSATKSSDAIA